MSEIAAPVMAPDSTRRFFFSSLEGKKKKGIKKKKQRLKKIKIKCVRVTRHWSDGTVSTLVGLGFVARYCLQ